MKMDLELLRASRKSWLDSSSPRVGPYWLQWVWTLLFCAVLAVGFTVLGFLSFARQDDTTWRTLSGWAVWYGRNLIVCVTIGSLIHVTFDLLGWAMGGLSRVHRWSPLGRTAFFSGIPLLCTAVGWPLGVMLAGVDLQSWVTVGVGGKAVVGSILLSLLMTFLFHQYFAIKGRQIEAEKRVAEAQLRLLQGQIEPHFLFNTLANVQALMDEDLPRARRMLASFTDYLRASLTQMRGGDSSLGQELDLAESYLQLLQGRMDDRLRYRIEADEAARRVMLPPLLVQPLVENAIMHGLEPQVRGGTVTLHARIEGQQLVIEVRDDGRGPLAGPRPGARQGHGMALANIRSRLLSRYGSEASLTLSAAEPGTRAVLRLPVEPAEPGTAAKPAASHRTRNEGDPR